jgi:hypothetical protein
MLIAEFEDHDIASQIADGLKSVYNYVEVMSTHSRQMDPLKAVSLF